jgi:hypothetical protein
MDATLWTATPNGFGGDDYSAAIPIKCRWVDRNEQYMSTLDKNEQISRAIVYLDRNVKVGDWLYNGVSTDADPSLLETAYKVRRFDKIPDLRNLLVLRKAFL